MPKKLPIKEVSQRLRKVNSEYECVKYVGVDSPNSLFIHMPTNTGPQKGKYGEIIKGSHPSWSPACKSRRDIDETIANQRLRKVNSEYECVKYIGTSSPNSLFVHLKSKTGPLPSTFNSILQGQHPSWSPACKHRQSMNINIANQRLSEIGSEYECTFYDGSDSPNSLFVHMPSGEGPKESRYSSVIKGKHPSWSPACKYRKDIDETVANERLKEKNREYRCTFYNGRHSPNSLFIHNPSGIGPKKSAYANILRGSHPSWSPTKKNINRIDPSNDKLCTVYFCKTKTYGKGRGGRKLWTAGPFLTIGVTTGNTKSRYDRNGLIKTYFEFETYNCNFHEKSLLDQITALLGQPDAGTEAWKWSQNREDITRKLFLDHFLKDYIENI